MLFLHALHPKMTVFTSSYPTVRPEQQHSGGVFDFTLTSANPHFRPEKVALVDALTGKQVRSAARVLTRVVLTLSSVPQLTYGELAKESLRFADGLTRVAKLQRGQSVLLFSPNSILYPVFLFAGQAAGLVVSTANSSYLPDELAHAIHLADAGIVLASADALDVAQKACKEAKLPTDRVYVVPGADGKLPSQLPHGMKSYETLRGSDSFKPVLPSLEQAKKDLAYLPFSSGTTGKAKGVALSAHNITTCVLQTRSQGGLFSEVDTVLSVLPMYHIVRLENPSSSAVTSRTGDASAGGTLKLNSSILQFGLVVMLHLTFYNGGTCVVLPKFDLVKALESVQKFKCTVRPLARIVSEAMADARFVVRADCTRCAAHRAGSCEAPDRRQV